MQHIIPAILETNAVDLAKKLKVLAKNTQWVHIDVMDGLFVQETSVSLSALEKLGEAFDYEIHLMVRDPASYLALCQAILAKRVIFHIEGIKDPELVFQEMQKYPFERGIALNPKTQVPAIKKWQRQIDALLLMGVHPGRQGQEFIPMVLEKLRALRMFSPDILLGVDGGIGQDTIEKVFEAGADYAVVGSGIWKHRDPVAALRKLEAMVQ
ncbi:MAG: orotidine 5'-phosphate decarboxylase [Parcubacteria group bacterium]|nr:orotidine 5'-phosphate decarboxylase [Parcubacteria group bacterium]